MRKRQSQLQLPDHPLSSSSSSSTSSSLAPHPFVSSSLIQLSSEDRADRVCSPGSSRAYRGITGLIWRERKGGSVRKGGEKRYTGREEETESGKSKRRQQRRKRVSLVFRAESARNRLQDPIYFSLLFFLLFLQSFPFNLAPSFSVVSWIASYYRSVICFASPSTSFSLSPVFPHRLSGFSPSLFPDAQVEWF